MDDILIEACIAGKITEYRVYISYDELHHQILHIGIHKHFFDDMIPVENTRKCILTFSDTIALDLTYRSKEYGNGLMEYIKNCIKFRIDNILIFGKKHANNN